MCFFFILHNHVLPDSGPSGKFTGGRRNCATFLYGVGLYALVYVGVKNLRLRYGERMDAFMSALAMIAAADACTMAYVYRSYYGRSIVHELGDADTKKWAYDGDAHKYRMKSSLELQLERQEAAAAVQRRLDAKQNKQFAEQVLANKERIRAARVIQAWWRRVLYEPPNGRFYEQAMHRFDSLAKNEK